MHLSWLGATTIKIQTKPADSDVTVIIDPYRPSEGSFPRSLAPDIALFTSGESGAITLSGNPFILSTPGECETKGVLVTAVQGHTPEQTFFRIDTEYMSLGHLGRAAKELTDKQLEVLSDVDILIVPIGNMGCYDTEDAVKAVNAVEPRIVIPMLFKSDNDPTADGVQAFLKAMGSGNGVEEKKVILKKKDLPEEETRIIVLAKE